MKIIYFSLLTILMIPFLKIKAETDFRPANTLNIKMYGGTLTGSSYFDLNEQLIENLPYTPQNGLGSKNYTFDYMKYFLGLNAEYSVTDKFMVFLNVPTGYNTLKETYQSEFNIDSITKADYSLFQIDYFGLGAKYLLYSKKAYMALSFESRIPHSFHHSILNDPSYPFLSAGAFEFLPGVILGLKLEKSWLETSIIYNIRELELKNQILIHTEAGLSTIPDTKLKITADFIQSTSSFKYAVPFDPEKTILQENIFRLGFGFSIFFTDRVYSEFSYNVSLLGKNSWNMSTFYLSTGMLIK
ncbi:MAG: hypothetical protein ABSG15_13065 [FCB group bacterium]